MMEIYGKTSLGEGALELGKPEIRLLPILNIDKDFDKTNILKREVMTISKNVVLILKYLYENKNLNHCLTGQN